jgi:sugar phosphate permease
VTGPERGLRTGLAGARRLWDARPLRHVTAGTTLAFAGAGALPLLVIARADELGSATAGAGLLAAMAAGALLGALLTAARERSGPPERRVVRALLVVGLALAIAGWAPSLALLGAALVVVGIADGTLLPAILLVRTAHSRPGERGAVFTTAASIKVGAGATGAALGGALIGAAGAGTALGAAAALQVAGALLCLGYRAAS